MTCNGPIKVLAVDDHPLVREGIGAVLASQRDIMLVAEAANGGKQSSAFALIIPMSRSWICKCHK